MKNYDKAIRLAFNAVALGLVIAGIIQAFAPYAGGPDPREAEIREAITHVVPVSAGDIQGLLRDPGGKPVMLVLYASWCGLCMVEMPRITGLMKSGQLDPFKAVFLSMDYDLHPFAAYLVHHDYQTLYTTYLFKGTPEDLQNVLKPTGSGYQGAIPYVGIFNTQGMLSKELFGTAAEQQLLKETPDNVPKNN